ARRRPARPRSVRSAACQHQWHCAGSAKHWLSQRRQGVEMSEGSSGERISIRPAGAHEVGVILQFIRDLAKYEHLEHEVVATEAGLREALFGRRPYAEVVFACSRGEPVGFALFFHNFSTFLGRPGIYLEDLFVRPEARGLGVGRKLLAWLAA